MKNNKLLFLLCLLISCTSPQVDSFLYTGVADDSKMTQDEYTKDSGGLVQEYNGWLPIIKKSFQKQAGGSSIEVFILKKDIFNMAFFPENKFFINTGTLDVLDKEIKDLNSGFLELHHCKNLNSCRDILIAPIVAHELAHYFQQDHILLKRKLEEYQKLSEKEKYEKILSYKRERELAADQFAQSLLTRNGYKPEIMIFPLKLIKKLNQELNRNPKLRVDFYLSSHPSPNERLSFLDKSDRYVALKELEQAFHFIAKGTNAESQIAAIKIIEDKQKLFPENLELKRARVTSYHRYWMYTASLYDLKFIPVIDQPLFSDAEEFNAFKGAKKIAGDEKLYRKTLSLYEEIFDQFVSTDAGFISNYAVLLAYSDKEKERKKSLDLAVNAFNKKKSMKTLNNLGIVYMLNGLTSEGIKCFWNEIPETEKPSIDLSISQTYQDDYFKFDQNLTEDMELDRKFRFISITNYTLSKIYTGQTDSSAKVEIEQLRTKYFNLSHKQSPWIVYLNNFAEKIR